MFPSSMRRTFALVSLVLALAQAAPAQSVYEQDLEFALRELPKKCGTLIASKGIDWKKVEKEFANAAKAVKSDQDHWVLLTRLLARLNDGHSEVRTTGKTANLTWPVPEGGAPVDCGNAGTLIRLLAGRPATTHWASLDRLSKLDPTIEVRADERFVDDGDLITSAGISAGPCSLPPSPTGRGRRRPKPSGAGPACPSRPGPG